jgi:hypothetical protein
MADEPRSLENLRVLFVTDLTPNQFGVYRLGALRRLGLEHVAVLDRNEYRSPGLVGKLEFRLQAGPQVDRFNRDLLRVARQERVNVAILDKVLQLRPGTLAGLRQAGVYCIDFVIDNPFGPRRDPGWRLYRKTVAGYDLTAVQRDVNLADYGRAGARHVVRTQTSFERTVHYPPPDGWSDAMRDRQVSFIGSPYDDRADFLAALWRDGVPVAISGPGDRWEASLPADVFAGAFGQGELIGDAYREAIWRSRISLAFVTRSNSDQVAQKAFEIAACGGFLLAERTAEHRALFEEDVEAVYFTGLAECRAKIDRYLPDEQARSRIAAAGRERAWSSGYDNDGVLRRLLEQAAARMDGRS